MASSPQPGQPTPTREPRRDERGVAFPSPLVILSVVAIAMAGFAFVATQDQPAFERRLETSASTPAPTPEADTKADTGAKGERKEARERRERKRKAERRFERAETYVEVYNNSGITGLAAETAARATEIGWQVVGEDNWYGAIPASTVYYPARLKDAAKQLALDLGIERTLPAVAPMKMDRLTVVLTADAA